MTKIQRLSILLTGINLVLLIALLSHHHTALAQGDGAVLRARGLELVDAAGQVRGQFTVEPEGEAVFRIRDAAGTIRVKLAAGSHGSGLLLLDETTEPAVHIVARRRAVPDRPTTTSISLTGAEGLRRTLAP
jgi:hypothetical protein